MTDIPENTPEPVPATNQAGEVDAIDLLARSAELHLLPQVATWLRSIENVEELDSIRLSIAIGAIALATQPATSQEGEAELECEYDEDGSYALIWKNGYAITAFPNGKVIITKTPCEPGWMAMGCDVSHLIPAETAAGIADAFARGQAQMIDEEGPDEACRGGKEVAEFIANAIRRRAALATQPATSQKGEVKRRHWEEIIGDMTDAGDLPADDAASICDASLATQPAKNKTDDVVRRNGERAVISGDGLGVVRNDAGQHRNVATQPAMSQEGEGKYDHEGRCPDAVNTSLMSGTAVEIEPQQDPDGWLAVKVNSEGGIVMPYGPLHPHPDRPNDPRYQWAPFYLGEPE